MSNANVKQTAQQRHYVSPALTVYGSVRDLTGGTSGTTGEKTGMMN